MRRHNTHNQPKRRGTTLVEMAVVLPVFFLFIFALMEFSHAYMVVSMLNAACKRAARYGVAPTELIVGAGAAGIAAARRLAAANHRFILVDAADRVGGRCITDTQIMGAPSSPGARRHAAGDRCLRGLRERARAGAGRGQRAPFRPAADRRGVVRRDGRRLGRV